MTSRASCQHILCWHEDTRPNCYRYYTMSAKLVKDLVKWTGMTRTRLENTSPSAPSIPCPPDMIPPGDAHGPVLCFNA